MEKKIVYVCPQRWFIENIKLSIDGLNRNKYPSRHTFSLVPVDKSENVIALDLPPSEIAALVFENMDDWPEITNKDNPEFQESQERLDQLLDPLKPITEAPGFNGAIMFYPSEDTLRNLRIFGRETRKNKRPVNPLFKLHTTDIFYGTSSQGYQKMTENPDNIQLPSVWNTGPLHALHYAMKRTVEDGGLMTVLAIEDVPTHALKEILDKTETGVDISRVYFDIRTYFGLQETGFINPNRFHVKELPENLYVFQEESTQDLEFFLKEYGPQDRYGLQTRCYLTAALSEVEEQRAKVQELDKPTEFFLKKIKGRIIETLDEGEIKNRISQKKLEKPY